MFVLGLLVNEDSAARLRRVSRAWHHAETGQGEVWWQLYVVHRALEDAQNTDPTLGWL